MRLFTFGVPLLFAILAAAPAIAEECVPTTSDPQLDTRGVAGQPRHYAHNDCPETGAQPPYDSCLMYPACCWWIYEESNGIDGLQRGDEVHDDTCNGQILPDTIVF